MLDGAAMRELEEENEREFEAACAKLRASTPQGVEAGERAFKWAADAGLANRQSVARLAPHFDAERTFVEDTFFDLLMDLGLRTPES